MKIFIKIKNLVKKIPKGKVTTYGAIARLTAVNPQVVGWALHNNKDPSIPCHRVVSKDGSLASGYAFGGPEEQKKRLLKEGIKFIGQTHVDLKNHLFIKAKLFSFAGEEQDKLLELATR